MERKSVKKKLKFVEDAIYRGEVVYKKGQKEDVENNLGFADRWLKRGIAIEAKDEKPAPQAEPAKPKPGRQSGSK